MSSLGSRELRKVRSVSNFNQQYEQGYNSNQGQNQNYQIEYSNEPYITTNHFAVFTPTLDSIEKLYKSNSFQPRQFINQQLNEQNQQDFSQGPQNNYEVRSQKSFAQQKLRTSQSQRSLRSSQKQFNNNQEIERFANQIQQQRGTGQLTEQNLNQFSEKQARPDSRTAKTPQLLHKLKSYKTNSTVGILQGLPIQKVELQRTHQLNPEEGQQTMTSSMKKTISYPGLPWVQLDITKSYEDPFSKKNQIRTQGAFRATGKETVADMISMSKTISSNLATMLKLQKDRQYLTQNRLIQVPKIVTYPTCQKVALGKKFLIAENDAHCRETNVGYSRKANGTFYNH